MLTSTHNYCNFVLPCAPWTKTVTWPLYAHEGLFLCLDVCLLVLVIAGGSGEREHSSNSESRSGQVAHATQIATVLRDERIFGPLGIIQGMKFHAMFPCNDQQVHEGLVELDGPAVVLNGREHSIQCFSIVVGALGSKSLPHLLQDVLVDKLQPECTTCKFMQIPR